MNTNKPNIIKITLSAAAPTMLPKADGPRSFKGIANSGRPFGYGCYQTAVVDFEGLQFKAKTPVLLEHSPTSVAGVCTLSVTENGLIAEGMLLNNEFGNQIAEAADQGFPWEMSVYVQAASYEELKTGGKAVVNGREVEGPSVIMKQCTVREVSFTAIGADANTNAVVLSDGSPFNLNMELSMTPEEKKAFEALEAEVETLKQEKAEAEEELAKAKAEAKKSRVKAKLSAAGFKETADGKFEGLSEATITMLLSASVEAAEAVIADLKPTAPASTGGIPDVLLSDGNSGNASAAPVNEEAFSVASHQGIMGGNYV